MRLSAAADRAPGQNAMVTMDTAKMIKSFPPTANAGRRTIVSLAPFIELDESNKELAGRSHMKRFAHSADCNSALECEAAPGGEENQSLSVTFLTL